MTLIDEFHRRTSIVENASFEEITPRLQGLIEWLETQPTIKQILNKLRARMGAEGSC